MNVFTLDDLKQYLESLGEPDRDSAGEIASAMSVQYKALRDDLWPDGIPPEVERKINLRAQIKKSFHKVQLRKREEVRKRADRKAGGQAGEEEGHAFRGNQYTEGQSGPPKPEKDKQKAGEQEQQTAAVRMPEWVADYKQAGAERADAVKAEQPEYQVDQATGRIVGGGPEGAETEAPAEPLTPEQWTAGMESLYSDEVGVAPAMMAADLEVVSDPVVPIPEGSEEKSLDMTEDSNGDGVTDRSFIGIDGNDVPDTIPRAGALTEDERYVESNFADAYEADPDAMADKFIAAVTAPTDSAGKPKPTNVFEVDLAKALSGAWQRGPAEKALYNSVLHPTANAIAKRAFVSYLDTLAASGDASKRSILVTAGGCGAGKGTALKLPEFAPLAASVGAVWDAAGENASTELPWALGEAASRGFKVTFMYVDSDPAGAFERAIGRAAEIGRMVNANSHVESHVAGALNFMNFSQSHPDAEFIYINNRGKTPVRTKSMPPEAVKQDPREVSKKVWAVVAKSKGKVPSFVYRAATIGQRIFYSKRGSHGGSKTRSPKA